MKEKYRYWWWEGDDSYYYSNKFGYDWLDNYSTSKPYYTSSTNYHSSNNIDCSKVEEKVFMAVEELKKTYDTVTYACHPGGYGENVSYFISFPIINRYIAVKLVNDAVCVIEYGSDSSQSPIVVLWENLSYEITKILIDTW